MIWSLCVPSLDCATATWNLRLPHTLVSSPFFFSPVRSSGSLVSVFSRILIITARSKLFLLPASEFENAQIFEVRKKSSCSLKFLHEDANVFQRNKFGKLFVTAPTTSPFLGYRFLVRLQVKGIRLPIFTLENPGAG